MSQGLPTYQVASWSTQPFGHNTPTLQTGHDRQRSDSICRIVLQTVAQNWFALCYGTVVCPVYLSCLSVCLSVSVTLVHWWRRGAAVTSLDISTRLLYVGHG